ncbi:sulfite reductase (NADPH) flavoprotein alpha-component [Pseudoxanthomonas sp. GM95]|uniref:sulfite reductase subunit alpha n=1 Tax=Pseudoxanthomonas sp. GM95 TaxID=1881043 RepID=UPI0008C12D1D|nr:flavodoxin domain-containing protein [Pseudoxanthomonas sp. GM95]SEL76763.1 sulfite reductase (NADPH) flavoprotein alpha-component [Pseudoxanthomonas sp. GM95]
MSNARLRPSRAALGNGLVLLALAAVVAVLFAWQPGDWWRGPPRPQRWIGAGLSLAAYVAFTGWILWRARAPRAETLTEQIDAETVLVAHASQTGYAIELALRTAQSLREGGIEVRVRSLASLDLATLAHYRRVLFVVSTTGEGDPPDLALGFVRDVLAHPAALAPLQYAVLALGDATYAQYCAFGRQLDDWLRRHGATPLFDRVEVDNADDAALRHWQHHLALLAGYADLRDWRAPSYEAWTLQERRLLNPGSLGGPVYHLALTPPADMPHWQAGDLVEIGPRHAPTRVAQWLQQQALDATTSVLVEQTPMLLAQALAARQLPDAPAPGVTPQTLVETLPPLPHREYSIASLPADGALHLLVRRMQRPDGSPGLASGWLCDHATPGASIALRLRANPNFHPPAPDVPLILIGNGTGIAGLRALLKSRIAAGARRNWLLFGERQRAHDVYHGDELSTWHAQGWLERLDLAFSRDETPRLYVQDALRRAASDLQRWIAEGAAVYVCGSLDGMAPGVDAVLQDTLGEAEVDTLRAQGRYRRDVY